MVLIDPFSIFLVIFSLLQIDPSGSDVIVLQPGSRYMKIGFANQAFPHIVPHVLAKSTTSPQFESTDERNDWQMDEDEIEEKIAQRYRQSRRKPPPNIYQSVRIGLIFVMFFTVSTYIHIVN